MESNINPNRPKQKIVVVKKNESLSMKKCIRWANMESLVILEATGTEKITLPLTFRSTR